MSQLPLQEMIAGAIKTASAKIAAEAPNSGSEKAKKLLAFEKREHGHIPSPAEDEYTEHEKQAAALCDAAHVDKLASAVEYIAGHLDEVAPAGPIAGALAKLAMKPGAGGGSAGGKSVPSPVSTAGALQTTEAIGGKQPYKKDSAKGEQAEDEHKKPLSSARPHDSKTQLDNNMHSAPGNNSGPVPKTEYPAKGPMVAGPSGKHNSSPNAAHLKTANAGHAGQAIAQFATKHPRTAAGIAGGAVGGALGATGGAAGAEDGHRMGGALKGALAGGATGAGAAAYGAHKFLKSAGSVQEEAKRHILMKLAGEDVMKASIDGGGTVSPLAGRGQLKSMKAGEQSPTQGGGNVGGNESHGADLIGSNRAAIDYTKREAKKHVVAPLKEVLDQPALSPKHDTKLQENLRNTGKAGVKIAGVQAELQKIASAGCTCSQKGKCQFCNMKSKLANMGAMGGEAGGMNPMANAGAGHDGCTCGHTGECRVCKLHAAMSAAKGGHPAEKDANAGCY